MKIAFVYDAVYPYRIGGVEKRIFELSRRLAQRGHELHIFALKEWLGNASFIQDGVYYHGLGHPGSFYTHGRRSIREAFYFGWKVFKPLLKERFDIIDCQNFPYFSSFSSAFASHMKGSNLVITWHEVWGDYWYDYLGSLGFSGKIIEKLTSRLSDHVIVVSELTKKELCSIGNFMDIPVISNGIDVQRINSIAPSDTISDVFFSGRVIKEKKVDVLIRAVALLRKELPGIKVVIAGDGPEKEGLQELAKRCNVEGNIRFLGFTRDNDELIALMKSSKVFVSPSAREGFGMAALEAMASGLPVVTSNAPKNAVKDLINGKNGIISEMDPEAYAGAILACFERRDSMSKDCKLIAQRYEWGRIVEEIEWYYERIAGNRS